MARNSITAASKLEGLAEIRNVLRILPEEMQQRVLSVAVRRAAQPLVKAAKALAPKRTGALRESIGVVVRRGKNGRDPYAAVGVRNGYYRGGVAVAKGSSRKGADNPAKYAHLVEFGHHAVLPQKGKTLRKKTASKVSFVPAKPFFRPAITSARGTIAAELAKGVQLGLQQALKRMAKSPATRS